MIKKEFFTILIIIILKSISSALQIILYPFLQLHKKILSLKNDRENYILNLIEVACISFFSLAGIAYYLIIPKEHNLLYKLLATLNFNLVKYSSIHYTLISVAFANIGNYVGNAINKIYCYLKFGDPYIYLTEEQLENITNACKKKGYTNINKEIISEIIKFCIKNSNYKKSSILGSKSTDWRYSIEKVMNSDLEPFLSQQQTLRNKRKEIISKIVSFFIYHQECHAKVKQRDLEQMPLLNNQSIENPEIETSTSFDSQKTNDSKYIKSSNRSSKDITNWHESFNSKIYLLKILEQDNNDIQINLQQTKKEFMFFKHKYKTLNKNKDLYYSEYTEYMMLDEYERYLYARAEEISRGIFPYEIINKITYNEIWSSPAHSSSNSYSYCKEEIKPNENTPLFHRSPANISFNNQANVSFNNVPANISFNFLFVENSPNQTSNLENISPQDIKHVLKLTL